MTPFLAQTVVAVVVLIAALLLLLMGYLLWLQIRGAMGGVGDDRPPGPRQFPAQDRQLVARGHHPRQSQRPHPDESA